MTDNQVIHEEEKLQDGVWVRMISPTQEECEEIADVLNVDIDDIKAALDEEGPKKKKKKIIKKF